ncbi:FecR domain-containing protein [Pseudomonas mangiferae]|uniref:FecR domain-containing protein n=1 Tax=Pseudomonas mangiferae TaxID=2593654 RepID=UPI001E3704A7|nr:FecR family protein [Pseudomonas mangiferae]
MNALPVSARVLDEAIGWRLCLDAGDADGQAQADFAAWHAAHPEHARAWAQLAGLDRQLAPASAAPARRALLRARPMARHLRIGGGLLGVLLVGVLSLGLLERQRPLSDWLADELTLGGEQRELRLPDQTRVRLNSRSALDVRFDAQQRRIVLRSGEILVETAHGDDRPFIVATADGDLRALGTRFLVRREADGTRLTVLQSAVAARPAAGGDARIVTADHQVLMHADRLEASHAAPVGADAWSRGMLVVENRRLGDLLATLGEYRAGLLGADPAVADLRISGSFPLYDSDRALAALPPSLPVRIERHTDWWVRVRPAQP